MVTFQSYLTKYTDVNRRRRIKISFLFTPEELMFRRFIRKRIDYRAFKEHVFWYARNFG